MILYRNIQRRRTLCWPTDWAYTVLIAAGDTFLVHHTDLQQLGMVEERRITILETGIDPAFH